MANLKAIVRMYLRRLGVLLGQEECKIRTTSTWPIKALWTIALNHLLSASSISLLLSLLSLMSFGQ
jgi:hypothetical protein